MGGMVGGLVGGIGGTWRLWVKQAVLEAVRSRGGQAPRSAEGGQAIEAAVHERAKSNGNVTREEAAAFLRVSTKTIQRMDAEGRLPRLRQLGEVVRYKARDVLRLASANGEEG